MTPVELLALYGVEVRDNPTTARYTLSGANVEQRGDVGIVVTVLRADGSPAIGAPFVINLFPDGHGDDPRTPDGSGQVRFSGNANSAYTPPARGPFTVSLAESAAKDDDKVIRHGALLSPSIAGLGDFRGEHTLWQLQFREIGSPPSELPIVKTDDELRNLAYAAAHISYNPDAALTKWARGHGLGVALASEGRYADAAGMRWAWQPFVLGIARCAEGDWGNIQKVEW